MYSYASLDGDWAALFFDEGITLLPPEDLQLDFNFGISLDGCSEDFIVIGVAVRY